MRWLLILGLPLVIIPGLLYRRSQGIALQFAPWIALPALVAAIWANPGTSVKVPGVMLGMQLGIDATGRMFLLFTALLWTVAGVYARTYFAGNAASHRPDQSASGNFFAFYLASMTGNLGLILAQDMVSFYLFFALMSFAAYGLVVHDGTSDARYAGKIYLALVVVGEVLLVSGLFLAAVATGKGESASPILGDVAKGVASVPTRNLIIALLLLGFGIKVGALPLHVWLPLAHPVAPTPASAVLSGAMIKAGLIGWLRFLPLGEVASPGWGRLCIVAGLVAAFYGVAIGLTQDNPKTALAYSSISQMGFMTVGVGVGFLLPTYSAVVLTAVSLYALHHALAKGALFLGVGVVRAGNSHRWGRFLLFGGLSLPALALTGAPLTSGAVAKSMLKKVATTSSLPAAWGGGLSWLLPLAAVGTTLLMGRFLFLMHAESKTGSQIERGIVPPGGTSHHADQHLMPGLWLPWTALLLGVAVITGLFATDGFMKALQKTISFRTAWPVIAGTVVVGGVWRWSRGEATSTRRMLALHIPAGDLLVGVSWMVKHLQQHSLIHIVTEIFRHATSWISLSPFHRLEEELSIALAWLEAHQSRWAVAGVSFLLLLGIFFALLILA